MQNTASLHTDEFPQLLARLPPDLDLDRLATEHKAIQRSRKIKTGTELLRLALAHGPGGMSLRDAAGWAGMLGLETLTNPAVKYRLDNSVDFLKAITDHLLAARSASQALHWPGRTIRVADGTCIAKPGSKGTDWRVHGVYDLGTGGFSNLELTDGKGAETLTYGAPVAGEVRIADRGYGRAKGWASVSPGRRWKGRSDRAAEVERLSPDRPGWHGVQSDRSSGNAAERSGAA